MNNAVLCLCIEKNKKYVTEDNKVKYRFYENEAINCVKSWRQNAGFLKDITIFCVCLTDDIPSQKTIDELKKYNVIYIERHYGDNNHPFLNTIYSQLLVHRLTEKEFVIYIDLDMYIRNPIPMDYLKIAKNKTVLCSYTEDKSNTKEFTYRFNNINKLNGVCFNTYFIITSKYSGFLNMLEYLINSVEYDIWYEKYIYYKETDDDYFYEEGLYDYIYLNKIRNRNNIYIIDSIDLENNYFIHKHLDVKAVINDTKLLRN